MQTEKFNKDLELAIGRQYDIYEFYRDLCHKSGIQRTDISRIIDNHEIYKLPSVFAGLFKKGRGMVDQLNDLSKQDGSFMISSSTYGDPSYVHCSNRDLDYVRGTYRDGVHLRNTKEMFAFCPPTRVLYSVGKKMSLYNKYTTLRMTTVYEGTAWRYKMIDMIKLDITKLVNKAFGKEPKGGTPFRSIGEKNFSKEMFEHGVKDENIVLGGISLLMYPIVKEYFKPGHFQSGHNVYVITAGGGWAGKKGRINTSELKKPVFVNDLAEVFGIKKEDYETHFKDLYSFCESPPIHEGYWSQEFQNFVYMPSPDAVIYAVDPETNKVAGPGQSGLFKVTTPYGCEYAANSSILQGDLIDVLETNDDGSVKKWTNVRRSPGLEIEGCAYETRGLVGEVKR